MGFTAPESLKDMLQKQNDFTIPVTAALDVVRRAFVVSEIWRQETAYMILLLTHMYDDYDYAQYNC